MAVVFSFPIYGLAQFLWGGALPPHTSHLRALPTSHFCLEHSESHMAPSMPHASLCCNTSSTCWGLTTSLTCLTCHSYPKLYIMEVFKYLQN